MDKYFKKSVLYYQKKLGLTNYQIHVGGIDTEKYRATCMTNVEGKMCSIYYSESWIKKVKKKEIKKTAFHEVMELNLMELKKLAKHHYSNEHVNQITHDIIRRAENSFYKLL